MSRISRIAIVALFQCLSLCLATVGYSADCRMRLFTMDNGLSNSHVNAIIQDCQGFIWVGTSNGLNRFDGYSFKLFLPGREVKCLYEDSKGNLWAGLLEGKVCMLDSETGEIRDYVCYFPSDANDGDVSGFVESQDGYMWISVDRMGLVRLNPETGGHIRFEHDPEDSNSLSHDAVTDMHMDDDGRIWITTWGGGLNCFDPVEQTFCCPLDTLKREDPKILNQTRLFIGSGRNLWIGTTYCGVINYNTETGDLRRFTSGKDGLASNTATDVASDKDGNVWLATADGISVVDGKTGRISPINAIVDGKPLTIHPQALFCDRDNTMWIGTHTGLLQYNGKFTTFDICIPAEKLEDAGPTRAVLKDFDGKVWTIDDRGLFCNSVGSDGECREKDMNHILAEDSPQSMFLDKEGDIWINYLNARLTRYSPKTGHIRNFNLEGTGGDNAFRNIFCYCEDADGSLWLGSEVGVVNFNPATLEVKDLYRSHGMIFPCDKTMSIILDREGRLWAATQGGIFKYEKDRKSRRKYTSDPNEGHLGSNYVNCILEDSEGNIWAGTSSGLNIYDKESDSFNTLTCLGNVLNEPVTGLQEDSEGNLWIASTIGLVRYNHTSGGFSIYDEEDGLLGREFSMSAMCKAPDGEILLCGYYGANRFYPEKISKEVKLPDIYIDDFLIFNEQVIPGDGSPLSRRICRTELINLNYDQSMLSFRFVPVNFISSHRYRYSYMLEGVDDNWNTTPYGSMFATYANVSPGEYVFKVKVSTDDGMCESQPVQVKIVIAPPFWATWWAWLFYVLAALFVIAAFIYFYLRRQRLKNRHEMDEFKLQFFTNVSHEFRTSLTLILGPLDYLLASGTCPEETRPMLSMMKGNASRLLRLVNQLLDFRKVEARKMTVNNSTQDIVHFLKDVYNVFVPYASQQGVEYVFSSGMDSLVMDFDKDKVDKVVYNLLSNAFKYTAVGGRIELSLGTEEKDGRIFVTIRVRDNGIGMSAETVRNLFTMFYQSPDRKSRFSGGSGLGLNMTKELLSIMGGHIEVESKEGEGSVFTAYIPCVCSGEMEEDMSAAEYSGPEDSEEEDDIPERNRPLVLVVDDNPDMQTYIRTALEGRFNVICAGDGEEGLQKTVRQMPDIIVSDVMMPGMDGMTFYSRLKDDERTSHIPVIMLSAISDESKIAESFRLGVDAYMTKPFSPDVLTARIENIFLKRREQRAAAGAADSFAGKLMECVNGNVQDPNYGIERLAKDMNLSAVQLSRKCKESLDMTPYSLIIKARMDTAVRLMKETDLNISEIAFRCGYQELSNFSRAFTRYWNESPKHLMKKVHK